MELELLELFSLVLPILFDRLREVTGLAPDEDEVNVLGVMDDGACRLVRLEVLETVVVELALLSPLDRLRIDEVVEVEVLNLKVRLVEVESVDKISEVVVVVVEFALSSILNSF